MSRNDKIYSATYSNVPVYEYTIEGNHVMRRRSDDWINATHILKVADYDKPARTRILEREVQKGVHEKVQGGYGKYQGTWIPLPDGRDLAQKNGVLEKLRPMFDFVPGDRSPPPAPKHATASSKPRAPRAPAQPRRQPVYTRQPDYESMDVSMQDGGSPDREAVSESAFDDFDDVPYSSRKRRRLETPMSQADREHQLWADELLDYFMLQDNPLDGFPSPPIPPRNADLNRPIDDKGHTALHWGAAMGDLDVVKDLIRGGASADVQSKSGETPLMRAIAFTNNYDRQNMEKLAGLLISTVNMQEWSGNTVFHNIANTTERKSKYQCARYYLDSILNKMSEVMSPPAIEKVLNEVDQNGDTAITIAARNGARKCVRSLIGRNADVSIRNSVGETADDLIVQLNHRRQERSSNNRQLSSSPFQGDGHHLAVGGAVQPYTNGIGVSAGFGPLVSQSSFNGSSVGFEAGSGFYRSEAALALTSSIFPALLDKGKSLASGLDAEIAEKEAEFAEAERVVEMRRNEIETLKRQQEDFRARDEEQTNGTIESDEQLAAELDELMAECEELIAREQEHELSERFDEEDAQTPSSPDDLLMEYDGDDSFFQKADLVAQLRSLTGQHADLVKQMVQNLSVAGVGDKQHEYKRLITGALGLREEDVEGMLPEIVAELEEYQGPDAGA